MARVLILRALQYLMLFAPGLAGAVWPRRARAAQETTQNAVPAWLVPACALALAVAAFAQFSLIALAARQQVPLPAWRAALPLIPIDDSAPLFGHTAAWIADSAGAFALLQTALLAALYFAARGRRLSRAAWSGVACAAALIALAALASRGLTSSDIYLYAGQGRLGLEAYAPPAARFPGEFGAINDLRGAPIYPSLYGPLWLGIAAALSFAVHGLAAQLFAFRLLGLAFLVLCLALLAALKRAPVVLLLFAVNPALYEQYVANAHNDLVALALVLAAMWFAAQRPWLALLFVLAAGSAKLPFAIAGSLAFVACASRAQRLGFAAASVLGAAAATYLASSGHYFATSAHMAARITRDPLISLTHDLAIALALSAVLAALAFRRYLAGASWSFYSLSTTLFPWYAAWSVPYALREGSLPLFLCTLPIVTFLLNSVYAATPFSQGLLFAAIAAPLLLALTARRAAAG